MNQPQILRKTTLIKQQIAKLLLFHFCVDKHTNVWYNEGANIYLCWPAQFSLQLKNGGDALWRNLLSFWWCPSVPPFGSPFWTITDWRVWCVLQSVRPITKGDYYLCRPHTTTVKCLIGLGGKTHPWYRGGVIRSFATSHQVQHIYVLVCPRPRDKYIISLVCVIVNYNFTHLRDLYVCTKNS